MEAPAGYRIAQYTWIRYILARHLPISGRGERLFGADEMDADLCIKDGMNFCIAKIHMGDLESSNALCEEI
jgi:hypothetical protein